MADFLNISPLTVDNHRDNIRKKSIDIFSRNTYKCFRENLKYHFNRDN
ncbi:MAG: hypothetical protein HF978_20315 [Desulfobacteraceae bacterium]|nr:hypothetical protein [Desulfobacteraceae bacterium]MBC2757893.1 hypothetical protein [Desulfobacteraceae bacterium]